jgi:hypothetical protein
MILRSIALACVATALTFTARAADGDPGYFAWAEAQGLVGVFASPDADFDGDGVTNLMSYAFGLDALSDDETYEKLPYRSDMGDPPEPAITFILPAHVPDDVSYIVEMSTPDGKRVEIARKNGKAAWFGAGRVTKRKLKDGSTEISVLPPLEMDVPEGENPLHLKVEFSPGT